MTDRLFAEGGPEGRNVDARAFEQRLSNGLAETLGWKVVASSVDTWLPPTRRSQGLDGLWAIANPRTGRGDGWVIEAKRHGDPARLTANLLGEEIQTLRDKIVKLRDQPSRFFQDPQIARHIQDLPGGLLFHHCRGFPRAKVRSLLADTSLRGRSQGPRPVRVLLIGADDLNALGVAVGRYGAPSEFWWPTSSHADAAWSPVCPPEQLAAGLLFFRTEAHGTVLLLRDELERRDVEAICDLAWRFGQDIDVVACAALRPERARLLSHAWDDARRVAAQRDRGRLPDRIDALEVSTESMAGFEGAWTTSGSSIAAAATRRSPADSSLPPGIVRARAGRRRRVLTAYPSAVAVGRTINEKASLAGAVSFLAGEGLVVFASEKLGAAVAAEETWLAPRAYRRMGDELETGGQPTVSGLRIVRTEGRPEALPMLGRGPLFNEILAASAGLNGVEIGERRVRLAGQERLGGAWPLSFELVYEDVYDLVGGERIARDAHVAAVVRPVDDDEVDVCFLIDEAGDRLAARSWLHGAFEFAARGWRSIEVALPRTDPSRVEVLVDVIRATAGGGLLGVGSPDQQRIRSQPTAADDPDPYEAEFARAVRSARYDTEIISVEAAQARSRRNHSQLTQLTAYGQFGAGAPKGVIALRVRQGDGEAGLSLSWSGGRQHTDETRKRSFSVDVWGAMRSLNWTRDEKRAYVVEHWAKAADTVRAAERRTMAGLRDSA